MNPCLSSHRRTIFFRYSTRVTGFSREFPWGALNRRAGYPRPSSGEGTRIISGMQNFDPYLLVLDPFWMIPNERLQTCCPCIEETDARIHGFTDKTHLAYAAAYNSRRLAIHYFLTTDEELPHLNLRCNRKCSLDAPEIVNPGALRVLLLGR
jgi:hypothetical protein